MKLTKHNGALLSLLKLPNYSLTTHRNIKLRTQPVTFPRAALHFDPGMQPFLTNLPTPTFLANFSDFSTTAVRTIY